VSRIEAWKDGDKEDKKKARDGAYQHHLKFSLGVTKMRTLEIQLPVCGLTWPVLISTIYLSILSSISIRWSSATPPAWKRSRLRTGGSCHYPASPNLTFTLLLMRFSACMVCVGVCVEEESCVCVRGRRRCYSWISDRPSPVIKVSRPKRQGAAIRP
jgi:hypothetical protein